MISKIKGVVLITLFLFILIPIKSASALGIKNDQIVDKYKAWTIRFSKEIELNDLIKQQIIVTDSKGNVTNVQLELGQDNKSILVSPPANGYTEDESYTLKIGSKIPSKDSKNLKQEIIMKYSIQKGIRLINNRSKDVNQGEEYILPKTLNATMDDNSKQYVSVSWMPSTVDTSKIGTYTFEGTVIGYDRKVTFTVNVKGIPLTTKEIVNKYGNAIVYIEVEDESHTPIGTGSGFIVNPNGTVVTNFHVIEGATYAKVKVQGRVVEYEVESVLDYNKKQDIAILKLKNTMNNLPTVVLGNSYKVELADNVVAIGNPEGLSNTISEGIISGLNRDMGRPYKDIQTSASIASGSSGGALFNNCGEVIGITYKGYETAGDLGFVIPIDEVKPFLNSNFTPMTLEEVNGVPLIEDIQVPTGLKVWAISSNTVYIQWDEIKYVDGYYVYFSDDKENWYYFLDDSGDKRLFQWSNGNSAEIKYILPDKTVYVTVTSVKNGVESKVSDIVSEKVEVDYFAHMSTVPEPYLSYTGYSESSSEPGLCRYSYPVDKLPETFFEDYFSTLEKYGWEYSHTFTRTDGIKVAFFVKDKQQISIKIEDGELYITGKIH